jgi:hypothetical protein
MGMSGGVKLTPQQPLNTRLFWVVKPTTNVHVLAMLIIDFL